MPDQPRSLPGQPSLRYLKVEARRRLAAGEFSTLHDAQLAIAREYGQPSWTALKQLIEQRLDQLGHPALEQLRWIISRFDGADSPDWAAPADGELREHFTDDYLGQVGGDTLVTGLTRIAARLREGLAVTQDVPLHARGRVGGAQLEADVEPAPPHRLTSFRAYPVGNQVSDARITAPPVSSYGPVPAVAAETAAAGFGELGLAGVVLAGGTPDGAQGGTLDRTTWAIARGWADLDRPEPLRPGHRFPAYGLARVVTATAVLRLVADDRVRLDDPANDHLRTVRLAGDAITVRELLSQAGGVDSPAPGNRYADTVPSLSSLLGPVLPCSGPRGTVKDGGHGDYAALGQLIADVTGSDYAAAVTRLVLGPLGMTGSSFPVSWPHDDPDAVTGYELVSDGTFGLDLDEVAAIPSVAGLWTTAADLVRLGTGWHSLLPVGLADEALQPRAADAAGTGHLGLGWRLNTARGFAGQMGDGPGGAASLMVRLSDNRAYVALTNRKVPVMPLSARVFMLGR